MAHATELGVGTSAVASIGGCENFSKKNDDGPSDPSKASANFHGCHCHHVGIPVGAKPATVPVVLVKAVPTRNGKHRPAWRRVGAECLSPCRSQWARFN